MMEFVLKLVAAENLVITSGSAESMAHECLGYIPGNMLLGAMATVWKRSNRVPLPDDNPKFRSLFINGDVSWGHAFPLCETGQSIPIPLSYIYDKNHGSLPPAASPFAIEDYWLCNQLALAEDQSIEDIWKKDHANENIKPKKIGAGFMDPASLHRVPEHPVFSVHVALGQARSALESQLYGYSALARGTEFLSSVLCASDQCAEQVRDLLAKAKTLHVGHARSAGYGRLELKWEERPVREPAGQSQKIHTLFLLSQYLPSPSWLDPFECLERELSNIAGCSARIIGNYSAIGEIQAYNSLWNRPRNSRFGLNMGSSLKISFAGEVRLPERLRVGGSQIEGYGRILCNPPFLAKPLPDIAPAHAIDSSPLSAPLKVSPESLPLWRILRERIAARQLAALVTAKLNDRAWKAFLEDVAKLSVPSASQRNNLRHIDHQTFKDMLEKSPGEQWRQAIAQCPFTQRRDHLSVIMLKLLDPTSMAGQWNFESLKLPGGLDEQIERGLLERKAHKLFINQLVSMWGNLSRLSEKE